MALSQAVASAVEEAAVQEVAGEARPAARPASRLLRNLAFLSGGQAATWILTGIWTLVVPRALGPSGMGQLTIAWSAVAIVNVLCAIGTDVLVTRNVARDHARAGALVATAVLLRMSMVPIGWLLVGAYILFAHFGATQILVLVLATAAMQVGLVTSAVSAAFQGIERMEYLAYADVFSKSLMTAASVLLVLRGYGVVAIMTLSLSIALVVMVLMYRWSRVHFRIEWHLDWTEAFRLLKGGLPFWANALFLTAYVWIDSVMLSLMTNETVVGWYGAPTKLFSTLLFIPALMGTAWFPRLVAAFHEGPEEFRRALAKVVGWIVILSLPVAAGLVTVSGHLIALIYGPGFSESAIVLAVLALLIPFTYLNIIASQALAAANRQLTWTKIMAGATVLNPLLNLGMIPLFQARWHNGAIGAALSLLATEVLMSIAAVYVVRHSLGALTVTRLLNALLASLLMAGITWLAAPLGLLVQVPVGFVTFVALSLVLRIPTAEERAFAIRFGRRMLHRVGLAPVAA